MEIRPFNGSKEDLDQLCSMYVELEKENKDKFNYSQHIGNLFESISIGGSSCFIAESNGTIAGFAIFYPDNMGGVVAQSLFLKSEFRGTIIFVKFIEKLESWIDSNYKYCSVVATNDYVCSMYDKRYEKQHTIYKYAKKDK